MSLRLKCIARNICQAAHAINHGGIVVYPTDTVYGLGGNPFNQEAVDRIYEIKKRTNKPFPVLCSNMGEVEGLVRLSKQGVRLASKFWPGPLTIVSEVNSGVFLPFIGEARKLGVRIPNHQVALRLIELCGGKLIGTSANRSGLKSPVNADDALAAVGTDFDILLDDGYTTLQRESTVVDATGNGMRILREGALRKDELE
jgi:L-threonylcarbamoyladenylate synthase